MKSILKFINDIKNFLTFRKSPSTLFLLAFSIVCLIQLNYSILRSLRNVLAVSCTEVGAELIPAIQLWALLPFTFLMVYGISLFMRYFGQVKVFVLVTSLFLAYFLAHALFIYPHKEFLENLLPIDKFLGKLPSLSMLAKNWTAGCYFIAAELWKVAILSVLFFGFLNRKVSLEEAKGIYSPILLGGSFGGMLAGPITVFCTKFRFSFMNHVAKDPWHSTFIMLSLVVVAIGLLTIALFIGLKNKLSLSENSPTMIKEKSSQKHSLFESIKAFMGSKFLFSLGIIVIMDYIAYFLFEVFFLDILKKALPDPNEYCRFDGTLTLWTSVLTLLSALLLTPILLKKKTWKVAALVTPSAIALSLMFFGAVIFKDNAFMIGVCKVFRISPLSCAIAIGSLQLCVCKAAKNTLFTASKEIAFMHLNEELQAKGKLVVDGLASRTGYSLAAGINQSLISLFGSFQAGLPAAAVVSVGAVALSIKAVLTISKEVQKIPALSLSKAAS